MTTQLQSTNISVISDQKSSSASYILTANYAKSSSFVKVYDREATYLIKHTLTLTDDTK
jgi:hypothetical protein